MFIGITVNSNPGERPEAGDSLFDYAQGSPFDFALGWRREAEGKGVAGRE